MMLLFISHTMLHLYYTWNALCVFCSAYIISKFDEPIIADSKGFLLTTTMQLVLDYMETSPINVMAVPVQERKPLILLLDFCHTIYYHPHHGTCHLQM